MPRLGMEIARVRRLARVLSPAALLVGGTWALWVRFNATGESFPRHLHLFRSCADFFNYYVPMTTKAAERLAAGEIPLWNPDACSGMPFLATLQTGVLYPGTWLALILPPHRALPALVLAECLLGGIFSALLFRAWGCSRWAASAGGLLFVFACGLGQTPWPPAIAAICWIPCLLLCIERIARGSGVGWWLGLAGSVALQILAGFPQLLVYTHLLTAPYAALRLLEHQRRSRSSWRTAAFRGAAIATAVAVGVGLAAVQLLPTQELVSQSARTARLTPKDVHYLNRPPLGIPFQRSDGVVKRTFDPSPSGISYGYPGTGYIGTATLLLAAVCIVARRREALTWLLGGLGGLALLLSDGYLSPWPALSDFYSWLPIVGSFRTPERLRVITFFCAAGLGALGFSTLQGVESPRRRRALVVLLATTAAGVTAAMAALWEASQAWRVALALGLALTLISSHSSALRRAASALLAVFIAVDLTLATPSWGTLRDIPRAWIESYASAATLEQIPGPTIEEARRAAGSQRIELQGLVPHVGVGPTGGIRRPSCYEPLAPVHWVELHRRLAGSVRPGRTLMELPAESRPLVYDLTSVGAIVRGSADGGAIAVANRDALPRAYFAASYEVASREDAFDRIARGDYGLRETVLLERDPGLARARPPVPAPVRPARIVEDRAESVSVEVEAPAPGLLVLTDTHYPGWEATVDGAPAEILLANGLHRAVALREGRHRIEFRYRPRSFGLGAAISGASLGVLVLVAIAAARHGWSETP